MERGRFDLEVVQLDFKSVRIVEKGVQFGERMMYCGVDVNGEEEVTYGGQLMASFPTVLSLPNIANKSSINSPQKPCLAGPDPRDSESRQPAPSATALPRTFYFTSYSERTELEQK